MQITKNGLLLLVGRNWPDTVQHWINKEAHGCRRKPLETFTPSTTKPRKGASLGTD